MSIPVWVLLGFAAWTLLLLLLTIGVYRWGLIFTGRASVAEWRADVVQGNDFYRRAMRAHANCIENLPVYGAVVVAIMATGIDTPLLDRLAVVLLVARVCQSIIHVSVQQTNTVATLRFLFFFLQFMCMAAMIIAVARMA